MMKLSTAAIAAIISTAACAAGPSDQQGRFQVNQPPPPATPYQFGAVTLYGSTYRVACEAFAAATCQGQPQCEATDVAHCCGDAGTCDAGIVVAPSVDAWDAEWAHCYGAIDEADAPACYDAEGPLPPFDAN